MTHIRMFEAFCGYGSQALAMERLAQDHPDKVSFEVVGVSDIDKPALQAYEALHGKTPNFGDISKIDWAQVPDFDLFTYSFPCFPKGTLVLTADGYKRIEEVDESDRVLTHTNQWRKVERKMQRAYNGGIVRIGAMGLHTLDATENHPFYVRKMARKGHEGKRVFGVPEWVKAGDLDKTYYLGFAINTDSELPRWAGVEDNRWGHHRTCNNISGMLENPDFWYLMGRYVGDGWKRSNKTGRGIVICCSERNIDSLLGCIERLGLHAVRDDDRTCTKMIICSKELHAFVERYGYYAHGKHIDGETMRLPKDLLGAFLRGCIDSDGCVDGKLIKLASVSEELTYGFAQCVAKVYNRPFSIWKTERPPMTEIEGRVVRQMDTYTIVWKTDDDKQDKAFYEAGYVWYPIRSVEKDVRSLEVYNMQVEADESYTANGCIVHNCTSISTAGKREGLEEGSGTKSSLLWECERAIDVKRPDYLLMENVEALTFEKNLPQLKKWLGKLERLGYDSYTKVLEATEYGVPQMRRRVFCVSVKKGKAPYPYYFPKPTGNGDLQAIFERDVPQTYDVKPNWFERVKKKHPDDYQKLLSPAFLKAAEAGRTNAVLTDYSRKNKERPVTPSVDVAPTLRSEDGNHGAPKLVFEVAKDPAQMKFCVGLQDAAATLKAHNGEHGCPQIVFETTVDLSSQWSNSIASVERAQTLVSANEPLAIYEHAPGFVRVRKLTPREGFRLMGLRDSDIDKIQAYRDEKDKPISERQQRKMAGNSIVVDVLYHIFRTLLVDTKPTEYTQLRLF